MFLLVSCFILIGCTSFIGIYLSRKVHSIAGYAVADRSLPLFISTATVFATWFGAESILGIPESFMEHGLVGIISDPIGSFICLLVLGLCFARRFYHMNVITIVDFFYNRYGKIVEVLAGIAIALSYLGWIAAQFLAFGSILSFMLEGEISVNVGVFVGAGIVIAYTFHGGMLAVAINDFMQTLIIFLSLVYMFFLISSMAGGPLEVFDFAVKTHKIAITFDSHYPNYSYLVGVLFSMILGTIPQQDTFQRITSAKSAEVAVRSTILGGFVYFFITLIPIFIVIAATKMELAATGALPQDFDLYIAYFVVERVPKIVQVFFFGALFAAILSTASGTILASSVVLSHNILGELFSKEVNLLVMRLMLVIVTILTALFAVYSTSSIHQLVENSGKVTMVIAFLPLIFGMFWKRTSYIGVLAGMLLSASVWGGLVFYQTFMGVQFEIASEVIGLTISFITIVIGSYLFPDSDEWRHKTTHHRHIHPTKPSS